MSTLHPISGEKIYIGGVLSDKSTDFVAADFSAQTWTLIDGWQTAGKLGDNFNLIKTDLINRGRTVKQKGTADAGSMQNNFAVIPSDPGQVALIAAANDKTNSYAFRITGTDANAAKSATVTITIATPGVITWTAHGRVVGDQVSFSTTGTLPTGITAGTTYFVSSVVDANTIQISATSGGSSINTTGTQTGVHTGTTIPTASERRFVALVMSAADAGGTANTIDMLQATLEVNSNIVSVPATGA